MYVLQGFFSNTGPWCFLSWLGSSQSIVKALGIHLKIGISFPGAGGLSNENLFGNFGRWDEPNRSINTIGKAASATAVGGDESDTKVVNDEARLHIQVRKKLNGLAGISRLIDI